MAETPYAVGPDLEGPLMAVVNAFAKDGGDHAEPLTVDAAYAQSCVAALAESPVGTVGLEIETHLVDLDSVADPVPCKRVETVAAVVGKVAPTSAVSVEPGGQIELSGRHGRREKVSNSSEPVSRIRHARFSAAADLRGVTRHGRVAGEFRLVSQCRVSARR